MNSGPLVKNRNATFGTRLYGNSCTRGDIEALHRSSSSDISWLRIRGSTYSLNPMRPNVDGGGGDHEGGGDGGDGGGDSCDGGGDSCAAAGGGGDSCDGGKEKRENWVVSIFREKILR